MTMERLGYNLNEESAIISEEKNDSHDEAQ